MFASERKCNGTTEQQKHLLGSNCRPLFFDCVVMATADKVLVTARVGFPAEFADGFRRTLFQLDYHSVDCRSVVQTWQLYLSE